MTISCPLVFHFRAFSLEANAHYAHFWIVKHFDRRLLKQSFLTELLDHVGKKQTADKQNKPLLSEKNIFWHRDGRYFGYKGGPRDGTGPQLAMQGILAHCVFLEISTRSIQSPVIWIKTKTALCFIKKCHIKKAKCKKTKSFSMSTSDQWH